MAERALGVHTNPGVQAQGRRAAFGVAIFLLFALLVGGLIANGARLLDQQQATRYWEVHTYRVLLTAKDYRAAMEDAETGLGRYLLSQDPRYLQPFDRGAEAAQAMLSRLAGLTRDNPRQIPRVGALRRLTLAHLAVLRKSVETARAGDRPAASEILRDENRGQSLDRVRDLVEQINGEEQRLLAIRSRAATKSASAARTALYALSAAGLLLLSLAAGAMVYAARTAGRLRVAAVERRAAEEMASARDFLQAVVDGAPDPIFAKDHEGRFIMANTRCAEAMGATREALIGRRAADFQPAEVAGELAERDRRILDSGVGEVAEERIFEKGEWRVYQSSKEPWIRDGVVVGLIGVSQDITERKQAEDAVRDLNLELEARVEARTREIEKAETQIRQMQKMESIGQLTGGIAHDFNNMLAIVIGSLDIAARRIDDDPAKARSFIKNAQDGAGRAATLTSRLLAFSRQQPLAPESLDANKLVAGMSEMLRRTIGEQVKVETVLAGGLWRTLADPGEVENALLNLCVNARDAMPEGGRLTVETANAHLDDPYAAHNLGVSAGQYVLICVTDTGTGMPPEVIERAFDPFYTTKTVGRGTGLGLSQVYGFIRQSGGHVKIYSEMGHGTTVKIYLPRWFGPDVARDAPARDTPAAKAEPGEIVLVVEDEPGVRNLSVDALRELGYTVIHADGALGALEMIEAHPGIHLLFTDIVMPDMNGRQLADRAMAVRPDLKVLYTTGYTRNAVVHNGVLDPGVAFLPKPFTIDQLAAKVRQVLDGK